MKHSVALITSTAVLLFSTACEDRRFEQFSASMGGPVQGQLAPHYAARTLEGDSISLSDYRGEAVLVNFWATWCKPCVAEFPDLIALEEELRPQGFRIVGVSIDTRPAEEVSQFLDRHGVTWTNVRDSDLRVDATFGWKSGVPKNLLLDRNGRVVVWWWGRLDTSLERNRDFFEQALAIQDVGKG